MAIFGGGVAGLSAAHELSERGFEVTVYEPWDVYGGKARSIASDGTGVGGRRDLPGEHGLRFFPGFYRHLDDTMRRIPFPGNARGVLDNLVTCRDVAFCRSGERSVRMHVFFPRQAGDVMPFLRNIVRPLETGIAARDLAFFLRQMLALVTSCDERRDELEKLSWSEFMDAPVPEADPYYSFLVRGWTRSFLALEPDTASAHTMGEIMLQMFGQFYAPGGSAARVLNGPTNDVWIDPWVEELRRRGVVFVSGARLTGLHCEASLIREASVRVGDDTQEVVADHYLCAVPVEVMRGLVTPELARAAPSVARLDRLEVRFMGGVQFYLDREVPILRGHAHYADASWALSGIFQPQFWDRPITEYGDGRVRDLLSVAVADWRAPGQHTTDKPAMECTPQEIADEVWAQILANVDDNDRLALEGAVRLAFHVDPRIGSFADREANREPLLVNTVDSWRFRPEATTEVPNLFLASDYVRTYTDLPTMEAANEAARRAVNGILSTSRSTAEPCGVWPMEWPRLFRVAQRLDKVAWRLGVQRSRNRRRLPRKQRRKKAS